VFAVIGAFYYLRVIKVMYFDEPGGEPLQVRPGRPLQVMFSINALALLVLGFAWSPIMAWCQAAFGI
jgi:NADH-quinone oxidoreductase subunit N